MDANKIIYQKYYIVKNKNITKMEIEDIKKELQENERCHLNENEDQPKQLCTMNAGEQKQNLARTTEEEMENNQQRNDISELKEKN